MNLGEFGDYPAVWVEITKADHLHGGKGWEFGTCLWSPSRDKREHDRYAIMREPTLGDLVLHFFNDVWETDNLETRLCGASFVAAAARETTQAPPVPGVWVGRRSYYRIDLRDYTPFRNPVPFSRFETDFAPQIRADLLQSNLSHHPFATYGPGGIRTAQGMYLARCTRGLFRVFKQALNSG